MMKTIFGLIVLLSSFTIFAQTNSAVPTQTNPAAKIETLVHCSGYLVARNSKSVLVKVILARENSTSLSSGQRELSVAVESQSPENQLSLKENVVSKNSKISIRTTYQTLNMSLSIGKASKPGASFLGSLQITQRLRPAGKPQTIGEARLNCR